MKLLKKLMVVFVAVMMTMTLTSRVYAAPSDASDAYKVKQVEVSGIKAGNTLKLYKIAQFNLDTATNEFSYTLATGLPAAYDTIDELAALTPDGYSFADGSTIKAAADALAFGIAGGTITPIGSAVTATAATGDKATIENLPAGWYIAVVSGTNDTSFIYQNMIIDAMPVVDAANNGYMSAANVTFEVKHTTDTVTKTVGSDKVESTDKYSVGDKVPFEITTNIPNYPNPSKVATFKITDTPDDLTDIITETGDDAMTVTVAGTVVARGSDTYTVTQSGDGFIITFAKDFILAHPGQAVVVSYKATIKSTATITDAGLTADNTAKITFNPNPNEDGTVEPNDKTELYTYGVNVFKYEQDGETKKKLTGAKFVLYKEDGTTVAGQETAVDSNGYVSWKGLAAGSYKLVETQAPAGYKLNSNPIPVTITKDAAKQDDRATANVTENYFLQVDVPNEKGATLPATGGIGTTIFHIAGAALVLGAGILLISKKRMNNN